MEPNGYNDNYTANYDQPRRLVKASVIATIIIIALVVGGLMLWYAATHGRIKTDDSGTGGFTLQAIKEEGQAVEESIVKKGITTVSSGKYIVRYKDGQSESLKYIEVPNFLRSVKVTFTNLGQRHVERVAVTTLSNLAQGSDGVMSVDTTMEVGNTFLHTTGDPSGLKKKSGSVPINSFSNFIHNNTLIGFTAATDSGKQQIQRYDFSNGKLEVASKVYKEETTTTLVNPTTAQNNLFGVTYAEKGNLSLDVYDGGRIVHQIKGLKNIAEGEDSRRAISITDKYLATGVGSNFSMEADESTGEEIYDQPKVKDYIVKIYDINKTDKEIKSVKVGKSSAISSIQLNNDGTYLSVADGQKLRVFNVENGDEVFTFSSTSIIDPQWVSGAQLIFGSVEDGFFKVDATDRSANALFSPDGSMNISSFDVHDNKVYFTAYSLSEFATTRSLPDGYVMYLDKDAVEGNQLVKNTPNENSQVGITSLDNTIYAVSSEANYGGDPYFRQIDPTQTFKDQVDAFLKIKLNNPDKYKLVYGNHL